MKELRFTLHTDGSSDQALLRVLRWLLQSHLPGARIVPTWADLRLLRAPPRKMPERIAAAIRLYPCEILFVHRDAEDLSRAKRAAEIRKALARIDSRTGLPPAVCVVPVRMQEAWMLIDRQAIRRAAGNPNGRSRINLPQLKTLEDVPDPKATLYELLQGASGLPPRRERKFRVAWAASRVADFIEDFSPLQSLPAFKAMEEELKEIIAERGWRDAE